MSSAGGGDTATPAAERSSGVQPGDSSDSPSATKCANPSCRVLGPKLRCSRCQSVEYCSRECQQGDWKQHRLKCEAVVYISEKQEREQLMTLNACLFCQDQVVVLNDLCIGFAAFGYIVGPLGGNVYSVAIPTQDTSGRQLGTYQVHTHDFERVFNIGDFVRVRVLKVPKDDNVKAHHEFMWSVQSVYNEAR